jgi:hypothetical protein
LAIIHTKSGEPIVIMVFRRAMQKVLCLTPPTQTSGRYVESLPATKKVCRSPQYGCAPAVAALLAAGAASTLQNQVRRRPSRSTKSSKAQDEVRVLSLSPWLCFWR